MAFDMATAKPVSVQTAKPKFDMATAKPVEQEEPGLLQQAGNTATEFMASVNRSALDIAGLPSELIRIPVNAGLHMAGVDYQIPRASQAIQDVTGIGRGGYMDEGTARDIVQATGEAIPASVAVGSALTGAASRLPALTQASEGVIPGVIRAAGQATPMQNVAYGALGGGGAATGKEIGQAFGGETGGTIGAISGGLALPVAAGVGARAVTNTWKGAANFGKKMFGPADQVADRVAAEQMQTNIVRSGETAENLAGKVSTLGDEGLLADTSPTLASLLGVAGRANPRVAGDVNRQLYARHEGQAGRLKFAVDGGAIGAKEVISRIASETKPAITSMYKKAADELNQTYGGALPPKIEQMLSGETSIAKASKKINQQMLDAKEAGLESTPFDRINYTKQVLDDQISKLYREGANNEARIKVALKNKFLQEADSEIPSFKEARDLFAGKSQLENAARDGELIFKMPVEDVKAYVSSLSKSEKAMYILGGQKAALQRIEDSPVVSDASKKLLGRNGDIERMKILFDEPGAFEKFKSSIQREADFLMTKRQFSGSQTAERIDARDANRLAPTTIQGVISRVLGSSSGKRQEKINDLAYKKIGDILTKQGLTIAELNAFLSKAESSAPRLNTGIKATAAQISTLATQDKREEKK